MKYSFDELRRPLNIQGKDEIYFKKACEIPLFYYPDLLYEQDVFVCRSGIGMKNFQLINATIPLYPGKKKHFYKYSLFNFFFRKKIKISESALLIHNHWSSGYYHWFGEALPRLILVEELLKDHILLVPENYPDFAFESLRMFKIKEIFKVPVYRNLIVKNLKIPENPPYTAVFDEQAILQLRERAHDFIKENKFNNLNLGEKIYVYRGRSTNRLILNSQEVENCLMENGFVAIDLEEYSFWQQVSIMYHARILVSVHGAGLTNQIFMKEQGYVYEFQKMIFGNEEYSSTYYKLSLVLNHIYLYQFCVPEHRKDSIYIANIHVDLSELEKNLTLILH